MIHRCPQKKRGVLNKKYQIADVPPEKRGSLEQKISDSRCPKHTL